MFLENLEHLCHNIFVTYICKLIMGLTAVFSGIGFVSVYVYDVCLLAYNIIYYVFNVLCHTRCFPNC